MSTTTTWVSPLNAAYGLATDGTYIYVSNTQNVPGEGYGSYINSYKISDKTTSSYLLAPSNNTIGPLTIGTYLYASYADQTRSFVATINYPTMTPTSITFGFNSYQDESEQNVNPITSAIVIAGNYLYASFYNGFLGRCVLTDTPGDYSNDYDFGTQSNFYYGTAGYNNLNNILPSNTPTSLATDNTYLYVGCSTGTIVRMTLSTVSGGTTDAANWLSGFSGITGLTVSSDNAYLYVLSSSASTITQVQLSDGSILSTYSLGSSYAGKLRNGIVSNGDYLYAANYGTGGDTNNGSILRYGASDPSPPSEVTCFGENTKILCFNSTKLEEEYVSVKYIRPGTLVKTTLNGYVRVDMIGKSTIHSYANGDRIKNRLYKCTKENYPEIIGEDLILTGCHSILVDYLTDEQREKTIQEIEQVYITDRKYRLFTFLDPRAEPYQVDGELPIYHIALENDNYYMNYGIYANGLLVETCSKRYLKNISGMTLIE
jgi:hypothetical protein